MSNIKDVARFAGVNISTVSRVLSGRKKVSDATKVRVLEAVRRLEYEPNMLAQGLKGGRTFTAALLIPNIRNSIFPGVSRGAEDCAIKNGYNLILCNTDEDMVREKAYIEMLRKRFVDGAIFATATRESDYLLELSRSGFPLVSLMRELNESVDAIVIDNAHSEYTGTVYLFEHNCAKVAFLNGNEKISLYRDRFTGYRRALDDKGVRFDPGLVQEIDTQRDFHSGYNAMKLLLEREGRVDVVFSAASGSYFDEAERRAVADTFPRSFVVPGVKAFLGETLGCAFCLSTAIAAMCLKNGSIPDHLVRGALYTIRTFATFL